jgi:branched-chain amino acid transport system permease protein
MAFGTGIGDPDTWGLQAAGVGFGLILPTALLALPVRDRGHGGYICWLRPAGLSVLSPVKAKPMIFVMASLGVMFVTNGVTRLIIGPGERGSRMANASSSRCANSATGRAGRRAGAAHAQVLTIVVALIAMVRCSGF